MIRISQIDDNLSIYREKVVILIGIGNGTKQIIDLLHHHKVDISYLCNVNFQNYGQVFEGVTIINFEKLKNIIKVNKQENKNVVVQISTRNDIRDHLKDLCEFGIDNIVTFDECINVLRYMNKYKLVKENPHLIDAIDQNLENKDKKIQTSNFLDYISSNLHLDEFLFVCCLPKTGDYTLMNTLNANNIPNLIMWHMPEGFDKKLVSNLKQKVKIIAGVREPISHNISDIYQNLEDLKVYSTFLFNSNKENFFINRGDAQEFFDLKFESDKKTMPLSNFFDRFSDNILNLSQYLFDKEKGYTIVKDGNIEVFVYQLEKLNNIVKDMSDWIGQKHFSDWVRGNEASSKWIANSYKQAQKELTFSRDYFDRCYNNNWVKHFYSETDIEKFKNKWHNHIIGNTKLMKTIEPVREFTLHYKKINTIPIVFESDETNNAMLSVTIISLLKNANVSTNYEIFILHKNFYSKTNIDVILSLQEIYDNCDIEFLKIDANFENPILTVANELKDLDKFIYLSGNVVVQKDLFDLYDINLDGFYIGGVEIEDSIGNEILTNLMLDSNVIIINSKYVRESKIRDNDVIDKVMSIDLKYNLSADYFDDEKSFDFGKKIKMKPILMSIFKSQKIKSALIDNYIFSYNSVNPLTCDNCSFSQVWHYYFRLSPFYDENYVKTAKISVIVAIYNVDRFLEKCLLSIINQTYSNLEIILVDDGSTDNSGEMCDDFAKKDERILVIHKGNGGLSSARNTGMDARAFHKSRKK